MTAPVIDIAGGRVNAAPVMDLGDSPARRDDALIMLAKQDLDPLSLAELEARIAALEREAARTRDHMQRAGRHRVDAEALFKR